MKTHFKKCVFFCTFPTTVMKNLQLIGFILVVAGSFLPLVHIPLIGNWNYLKVDQTLAITCWLLSMVALLGILTERQLLIKVSAILLIILFVFTIWAVKFKSLNYFSFIPLKSWQETAAGIVKLKWGWFLEFSGAALLLFSKKN